jgi:transcriptional regulator
MYIPNWHREENKTVLHDLMRTYSFATLVTNAENTPFASHLPFLLDAERGANGTLRAHLARANPQWQQFREEQEALVIFQGPHAYISPSWYDPHPGNVPTWNYAVVHAYGIPRLLDDAELKTTLHDLVQTYEAGFEQPWVLEMPEDLLEKMLRGIVGFKIEITRLEGKLKLSQNRPAASQERVLAGLRQSGDPLDAAVAEWMERALSATP